MTDDRPLIIRRIDAALAKMAAQKMMPRAIYLTERDYKLFARTKSRQWRQATGSKGHVWPLSYGDVPLISKSLIPQMEVPVRVTKGKQGSIVYSTHGVGVKVAQKPPEAAAEQRKKAA